MNPHERYRAQVLRDKKILHLLLAGKRVKNILEDLNITHNKFYGSWEKIKESGMCDYYKDWRPEDVARANLRTKFHTLTLLGYSQRRLANLFGYSLPTINAILKSPLEGIHANHSILVKTLKGMTDQLGQGMIKPGEYMLILGCNGDDDFILRSVKGGTIFTVTPEQLSYNHEILDVYFIGDCLEEEKKEEYQEEN